MALAALVSVEPLRRIRSPLYTAWVNQRLDPNVRATIISMSSQADALGQIVGGPILGLIATAVSLRAALVAAAVMLGPALALYLLAMRRVRELGTEGEAEVAV